MFDRLEVSPAYKTVCQVIETKIMEGQLGPGDALPTETELAEQFGLTRHTVREGLRILEQSGLVQREAGRRLFVKRPHYAELAPRASRALIMQRVTFEELWEVTMSLEPRAAHRAAARISPADLEKLEDNLQEMEQALGEGRSIIGLDVVFHTLVAEIAANRALLLAREPISQLFYPALEKLFTHPDNHGSGERRLVEAHRHIIAAFKTNNAEGAEDWMRRHIADFRRGYQRFAFDLDAPVALGVPSPA